MAWQICMVWCNKIEEADEFDYDAASMEEEMRDQKSEDAAMMMDSENL